MRPLERVPDIRPENLYLVLSRKFVSQLRMVGISTDPDTHWTNFTKLFCGAMADAAVLPESVVLHRPPRLSRGTGGETDYLLATLNLQFRLHDPDLFLVVEAMIMDGSPAGIQPHTLILKSMTDIDPVETEALRASTA